MRILWLCNIVPPVVAKQLNTETSVKEGWISGILKRISEEEADITLGICAPVSDTDGPYRKDNVNIGSLKICCYRFLEQTASPWVYDVTLERTALKIIEDFKPDMIHSFGSEYPHTLSFARAWNKPEKFLIGLQGIMRACTEAYCGGLDEKIVNASTFRDIIKKDNIAAARDKFAKRAEFEEKAIKLAGHVAGRTEFDKNESLKMNPQAKYHYMGETMRSEFYEGSWNEDSLDGHVIFVSQADYPLKGFHVLLEAMPAVLKRFPDAKICVAGNSITNYSTIKEKLKICNYGKYLRSLMEKNNLLDKVSVLGRLSAEQMKQQYLRSSVYVCTSFVENSPNSVGEAMLLGTPVIATETGGIPSLAEKDKEALFVRVGDCKELSDAIIRLFENRELAISVSKAARERARINHDADKNYNSLMEIYKKICQ